MRNYRETQVGDLVDMVLSDTDHYLDARWEPSPSAGTREHARRLALHRYVMVPAEKERYAVPARSEMDDALLHGNWADAAALAAGGPDPAGDLAFIGPAILYVGFLDGLLDGYVGTYGNMSTDEQGRYIYR